MTPEATLTAADILSELVDPGRPTLSPDVARQFLSLRFNETATTRIRDLLQKNNAGTITTPEKATLENYLQVGELLDLLQVQARQILRQSDASAP